MVAAGSVAVVTGGGTGIGAACGVALAEAGWTVVLAGRRAEPLESVRDAHPHLALDAAVADVTDEASVAALFTDVVDRHGRLDLLFNNAGRGGSAVEPDAIGLDEWRAVVDTNLTGTFLCTKEAFRIMREQRPQGGRILNNGSISAQAPRPLSLAYTATKHAITGLTKSVALDGRPYGIACGQIDIGNASTSMTAAMSDGVRQADGSIRPEPTMPVADVAAAVVLIAGMPLTSNVASMTVMATGMPLVGRG
ncbi:SDR family oxidoreductase [Amnibacterium sp.]|uniref:SDR family oxidoreductase n=1 Tax=Amnibacterium sp. TaxID=1872496 RepID=UPI002637DD54|nr:SDR family oxidoreductase [Amnibacterium sp.]MCU1471935.1 putative oxidoreductase [Amnibacterium sp.]